MSPNKCRSESKTFTTAPPAGGEITEPEFLRPATAAKFADVSRSTIYTWLPKLKTFSVRQRGAKNALRLIELRSLREFILSQADGATGDGQ